MNERFQTVIPDVIVLAAGFGKRMMPLTATTPKPLIKVSGTALVERVMDSAIAEGARHFVLNAHYLADQIAAFVTAFPARHPGVTCDLSLEKDQLRDTGGGIVQAMGFANSDPFFVMNSDAFWPVGADRPIMRMQDRFAQGDLDAVLLCAHPARALGFRRSHDFCLSPMGAITYDTGLPVIYAGVALFSRALFADAPDGPFSLNILFEKALETNRLGGILLDAPWYHVGDPEALAEVQARLGGASTQ